MDLMEMRMRQQPLHWGADLLPERRVDIPVLPPVASQAGWKKFKNKRAHRNQNQGYEMFSPKINIKLENDQKKMLSQLPWSYADAVKKPNNKQANQPVTEDENQMEDQSPKQNLQVNGNKTENEREADLESPLNPDANEFIPVAASSDKDEMTESNTTTTDNESEDISELEAKKLEAALEMKTFLGMDYAQSEMIDKVNGNIQSDENKEAIDDSEAINSSDISQDQISLVPSQNLNGTEKEVHSDPFSPMIHYNGDNNSAYSKCDQNQFEENFVTSSLTDEHLNSSTVDKTNICEKELNFDELVKNKTNYSDSHFYGSEMEANLLVESSEGIQTNGHLNDIILEDQEINETYYLLEKYDNFNKLNPPMENEENETDNSNKELHELSAEEIISSVFEEGQSISSGIEANYQNLCEKPELISEEHVESVDTDNVDVMQKVDEEAQDYKEMSNSDESNRVDNFYVNENFFSEEHNCDYEDREKYLDPEQHLDNIDSHEQEADEREKSTAFDDEDKENIEEYNSADYLGKNTDKQTENNNCSKQFLETPSDESNDNESSFEIIPDGSENCDEEEEQGLSMETSKSDDKDSEQGGPEMNATECFDSKLESIDQAENSSNTEEVNCEGNSNEYEPTSVGEVEEVNQADFEQVDDTDQHDEIHNALPENAYFTDSCDDVTPVEESVDSELTLTTVKINNLNQEDVSSDNRKETSENVKPENSDQKLVTEEHANFEPLDVNEEHYTEMVTEPNQEENSEDKSEMEDQSNTVQHQNLLIEEQENVAPEVEEELLTQEEHLTSSQAVISSEHLEETSVLNEADYSPLQETIYEKVCEDIEALEVDEETHSNEPSQKDALCSVDTEAIPSEAIPDCTNTDHKVENQYLIEGNQTVGNLENAGEIVANIEGVVFENCHESVATTVNTENLLSDQNIIEEEHEFIQNLDNNIFDKDELFHNKDNEKNDKFNVPETKESQLTEFYVDVTHMVILGNPTPNAVQETNLGEDISLESADAEESQSIGSMKDTCFIEEEANILQPSEPMPEEIHEIKEVQILQQNEAVHVEESHEVNTEINKGSQDSSELEEQIIKNELHSEEVCEAQEVEEENQFIDELTQDKNIEILPSAGLIENESKKVSLVESYDEEISMKLKEENENSVQVSEEYTFEKAKELEAHEVEKNLETIAMSSFASPLIEENFESVKICLNEELPVEDTGFVKTEEPERNDSEQLEEINSSLSSSVIAAAAVTSVAVGAIAASAITVVKETDTIPDIEKKTSLDGASEITDAQSISPEIEGKKPTSPVTKSSPKKTPSQTKTTDKPSSPVSGVKSKTAVGKTAFQPSKALSNSAQSKPLTPSTKSQTATKTTAGSTKVANASSKPAPTKAVASPGDAAKPNAPAPKATAGVKSAVSKPTPPATKSAASKPMPSATTKVAASPSKLVSQTKTASPTAKSSTPVSSKAGVTSSAKPAAPAKPAASSTIKSAKSPATSKPAGANVSKTAESGTGKSASLSKTSASTAKPSTPTSKSATSAKPMTPKPTSAVLKSSSSTASSPKTPVNKPGSPTTKVGSTTPKTPVSNAAKPSVNKSSTETSKVSAVKTSAAKPTTPPIKSASLKPTSAVSKTAPATKKPGSPVKQTGSVTSTGTKPSSAKTTPKPGTPLKSAAGKGTDPTADKAKVAQNKTPAKKSPSPIKKITTDKNAKNSMKPSVTPDKNSEVETKEEETVTSTTQDFPIKNGLVIDDSPPQITV